LRDWEPGGNALPEGKLANPVRSRRHFIPSAQKTVLAAELNITDARLGFP
jgi:hypothetical protein